MRQLRHAVVSCGIPRDMGRGAGETLPHPLSAGFREPRRDPALPYEELRRRLQGEEGELDAIWPELRRLLSRTPRPKVKEAELRLLQVLLERLSGGVPGWRDVLEVIGLGPQQASEADLRSLCPWVLELKQPPEGGDEGAHAEVARWACSRWQEALRCGRPREEIPKRAEAVGERLGSSLHPGTALLLAAQEIAECPRDEARTALADGWLRGLTGRRLHESFDRMSLLLRTLGLDAQNASLRVVLKRNPGIGVLHLVDPLDPKRTCCEQPIILGDFIPADAREWHRVGGLPHCRSCERNWEERLRAAADSGRGLPLGVGAADELIVRTLRESLIAKLDVIATTRTLAPSAWRKGGIDPGLAIQGVRDLKEWTEELILREARIALACWCADELASKPPSEAWRALGVPEEELDEDPPAPSPRTLSDLLASIVEEDPDRHAKELAKRAAVQLRQQRRLGA